MIMWFIVVSSIFPISTVAFIYGPLLGCSACHHVIHCSFINLSHCWQLLGCRAVYMVTWFIVVSSVFPNSRVAFFFVGSFLAVVIIILWLVVFS